MKTVVRIDDSRLRAKLDALERRSNAIAPALRSIGAILVSSAQLSFRESRDPWGKAWAPLSFTTRLQRGRRAVGGGSIYTKRGNKTRNAAFKAIVSAKPLLDTGRLRNSLTFTVSGKRVTVGTNVRYAPTHQFGAAKGAYGRTRRGSPIPWGRIPSRAFLPIRLTGSGAVDLPLSVRREIVEALATHLLFKRGVSAAR